MLAALLFALGGGEYGFVALDVREWRELQWVAARSRGVDDAWAREGNADFRASLIGLFTISWRFSFLFTLLRLPRFLVHSYGKYRCMTTTQYRVNDDGEDMHYTFSA